LRKRLGWTLVRFAQCAHWPDPSNPIAVSFERLQLLHFHRRNVSVDMSIAFSPRDSTAGVLRGSVEESEAFSVPRQAVAIRDRVQFVLGSLAFCQIRSDESRTKKQRECESLCRRR
jgi:hypothetical protein